MLHKLEKRVRQDIRLHNPFMKGEKILVFDNQTKESYLTLYLLKRITKGLDLDIKVKQQKDIAVKHWKEYNKIILPLDGDDIIKDFIEHLTFKQIYKLDESRNKIFFLKTILDKEVAEAVKKLGYNCKESAKGLDMPEIAACALSASAQSKRASCEHAQEHTAGFGQTVLDKTEKRYPGSKFAFLKSIQFLKNIIK